MDINSNQIMIEISKDNALYIPLNLLRNTSRKPNVMQHASILE